VLRRLGQREEFVIVAEHQRNTLDERRRCPSRSPLEL